MRAQPDGDEVERALTLVTDPHEAGERLTFHGAWGHAHRVSVDLALPLPRWLEDEGRGRRAWALHQHLRTLHDLRALAAVLDAVSVPWLAFKGPTLSALYPQPDLRGYTDLDVLVAPGAFPTAVGALLEDGWRFVEWPADLERRPPVGEVHLKGPTGSPVDLHWHPFYSPDHVTRGQVDPAAVVDERVHSRIGADRVPMLPHGTHLVYVCAHAAAGGGNRLRWLTDIAHLSSRLTPSDWRQVADIAERWHLTRTVGLMLSRAARHVDAVVPTDLVARMAGRGTLATDGLLERVDPLPASQERGSATAALARTGGRPFDVAALSRRVVSPRLSPAGSHGTWHREDLTTVADGRETLHRFAAAVADEVPGGSVGP